MVLLYSSLSSLASNSRMKGLRADKFYIHSKYGVSGHQVIRILKYQANITLVGPDCDDKSTD